MQLLEIDSGDVTMTLSAGDLATLSAALDVAATVAGGCTPDVPHHELEGAFTQLHALCLALAFAAEHSADRLAPSSLSEWRGAEAEAATEALRRRSREALAGRRYE